MADPGETLLITLIRRGFFKEVSARIQQIGICAELSSASTPASASPACAPLHWVAYRMPSQSQGRWEQRCEDYRELACLLLEKLSRLPASASACSPLDARTDNGRTPLMQAASVANAELVDLLLDARAGGITSTLGKLFGETFWAQNTYVQFVSVLAEM